MVVLLLILNFALGDIVELTLDNFNTLVDPYNKDREYNWWIFQFNRSKHEGVDEMLELFE
jgi:hypothetical protein